MRLKRLKDLKLSVIFDFFPIVLGTEMALSLEGHSLRESESENPRVWRVNRKLSQLLRRTPLHRP